MIIVAIPTTTVLLLEVCIIFLFSWRMFCIITELAPQSNLLSLLYDVGMLPGSVLLGWLSDRLYRHRRAWVIATCTSILLPCLILCGR